MIPLLIDTPPDMRFTGIGSRRTRIGQVVEELVCSVMGWKRVSVGSHSEFSPDAVTPLDSLPIEIKSVSCGVFPKGKSVLYDFRMEKEARLAPRLCYCFFCYRKGSNAETLSQWLDWVAAHPCHLVMSPAWEVHAAARSGNKTVPIPDGRQHTHGFSSEGYRDGYYNLSIGSLLMERREEITHRLWGRDFGVTLTRARGCPWRKKNEQDKQ